MKNAFVLTIITFSIIACSPKTASNAIGIDLVQKTFNEMVAATNAGELDKMLDFTYPKMFDLQPKEQVKEMYNQMSMMGIKNTIGKANISDLSKFVTSGDQQFAKGKLTAVAKIAVSDKSLVDMLYNQMKTQVSEDKMRKVEDGVEMDVNEDLYVITDNTTKKMYFLQVSEAIKPMLGQILPADVMEKLK